MKELEGKRPAEIVRAQNYGTEILRGQTRGEVLKAADRGVRRGDFRVVGEVVSIRGGGYAAKAVRARPLPEPMPMWVKICVRIGLVLMGLAIAGSVLVAALSMLLGSLLALPWKAIGGVALLLLIAAMVTSPGRKCCTFVVKVFH